MPLLLFLSCWLNCKTICSVSSPDIWKRRTIGSVEADTKLFLDNSKQLIFAETMTTQSRWKYDDFQNRNSEKSHRATGARSDLRPDWWSWANSGLETSFGIIETEIFWLDTMGALTKKQSTIIYVTFKLYAFVFVYPGIFKNNIYYSILWHILP